MQKVLNNITLKREHFIQEREGDIKTFYIFKEKLGEGAYGEVFKALEKASGEFRAIKKMKKDKIKNHTRFLNELTALKTLDHPHIIKLYEIFENEHSIYLVQEYCSGGELFEQIAEQEHFDEHYAAVVFEQIIKALWYCHKNMICHRDLKPENFMFSNSDETACLKLIDFGLAKSFFQVNNTGQQVMMRMETKAGTAFFMAPEVLRKNYSSS